MIAKRLPRLAAAFVAATVMVGGLAVAGTTSAQAATLGSLKLFKSLESAAGNQQYFQFQTSAACPATANAYSVRVTGPGIFNTTTPINLVVGSNGFSSTAAFTAGDAATRSILDVAHDLGGSTAVNPVGVYTFTLSCINDFAPDASLGEFKGALNYTTPTEYQVVAVSNGPAITKAATATGAYKVGVTQTCSAAFSGATSVAYSWLSNGATIGGATASKYTPTGAQYNRSIACRATGKNAGGTTVTTSAAHKTALGNKAVKKSSPKITGTAKVKKTLKAKPGTWSLSGVSYSYQWKANGKAISGAKKSSYKIAKKYKGKKLTVTVTVKKAGYATATATSSATKKVKK